MAFGPIQLLVVGVDRPGSHRELLAEFQRLRESDAVRLLDVLVVHKDADGVVERAQSSDVAPGEADGGILVEALVGLGPAGGPAPDAGATDGGPRPADDEFWSLDEAIPNDSDAVLVLIEHRWAIATRERSEPQAASRSPTPGTSGRLARRWAQRPKAVGFTP